ncbi:uncharacterized protein LOC123269922 [Cotesia glomerata]|uniref:uncharacterized protein LOC123269922 n=1 Tax=Cotesia glomerata TaxID=32391 RepID=UPI001D00D568|nr:uncharacterized protein LOC123269922 [Cotesia glomerata]XP_044591790.1 uncharacterized protein LOC123269922 [Cotesia glomerata]XP_044591791.1 uncharacterized protein LOC123269922 [Cotesia glomerata]XP_044591792.1 uncharacterized protein LOC123269922 [Cotesia glomerata]XP_044591793.1 uncharacterized protein LOC123269922 [Cotesia glomerata]XP_044591794.1 uncharacterized protein LOC123269922 [Cotesia glomerata]
MDPELNPTTAGNSLMYQAIEEDKLEDLKLLLENGMDVNEPIITTGEFAGFTALHVACMKNKDHLVDLLVNDYKADVNAMAADGTEPILLACFYEPLGEFETWVVNPKVGSKIPTLVKANANVNAEFGQEILSKHFKDREWCPDFGDKMPLAVYTVIYDKPSLTYYLKKINLDIISLTNKTLLMYAAEKKCYQYIFHIVLNVKDPLLMDKLINHRDNDDVPLTHYPFHPKKYGKFRYHETTMFTYDSMGEEFIPEILSDLGTDLYALINNDPATFLPNLAAYRGCPLILEDSLPYYTSMSLSRALYYATLPIDENSEDLVPVIPEVERLDALMIIRANREDCIDIALRDLVFRSVFRLPGPEEEIKLMEKLVANDEKLRATVNDFKRNFIEKELQESFIEFGDKKMTMYDFLMQVFDNKKLKFLAREENSLNVLHKVFWERCDDDDFYKSYYNPIKTRIENAKERLRHLENLKKISSLRKAIPLPFELVLEIVEYLNNKYLNLFIKAFYSS